MSSAKEQRVYSERSTAVLECRSLPKILPPPAGDMKPETQKCEGTANPVLSFLSSASTTRLVGFESSNEQELKAANSLAEAQVDAKAAPLLETDIPLHALPRRKVVWVWICCYCGHGGMKVSVDPCPQCGVPRCPNCDTQRFNTR